MNWPTTLDPRRPSYHTIIFLSRECLCNVLHSSFACQAGLWALSMPVGEAYGCITANIWTETATIESDLQAYFWDQAAHDAIVKPLWSWVSGHKILEEIPERVEFKLSFVECIISSKVHLLCYHSIVNIIPRASQPTYAVLRAGPTPPIQMPLPSPPIQNSSLFPISSDFLPTIHPQTIRFQHPTLPQVLQTHRLRLYRDNPQTSNSQAQSEFSFGHVLRMNHALIHTSVAP